MKTAKLSDMTKGWLVGNFDPSLYKTTSVEVAVKSYKTGDYEETHHHKIATEITVIISGKVKINNVEYTTGDIIVLEPYEAADFLAMDITMTTVIKIPGANHDKFLGIAQ